jgi:peptidyl-prolyl cis-trans isomerase A (cyclophilin A)
MPGVWTSWWEGGKESQDRKPIASDQEAIARCEEAGSGWSGLESLEPRLMLAATVTSALPDIVANKNQAAITVNLNNYFDDPALAGTVVKFDTVMGVIPVLLYDQATPDRTAAPVTVTNFLHYVNGDAGFGTYNNSIVHRSDPGSVNLNLPVDQRNAFIIQGGGFSYIDGNFGLVNSSAPTIVNEYSSTRPNVRGTIAMALAGGDINSASDQWFINLGDNTSILGSQSSTVFGQVVGSGMDVVDAISALPSYNASSITSAFNQMPLRNLTTNFITPDNVILINQVIIGKLIYTVTTDAPTLLNAATDGSTLTLNAAANQTGSGHVTITATDINGVTAQSTFLVTVQAAANPPVIGSLKATPNPVNHGVQTLTLTAANVVDPGGALTKVEFFRDTNGNGQLDPGIDAKLGQDTSADGGWTITVPTTGWATGATKVFARAQDDGNKGSSPAEFNLAVGNKAPTLTLISPLIATVRSAGWTISYNVLKSHTNAADVNGDPIKFRIMQVTSGTLTINGSSVVPGTTLFGPSDTLTWTPQNATDIIYNSFTIRAWDGVAASSSSVQVKVEVDQAPVVKSMIFSPSIIAMPGSAVTLSAKVIDPDDSVAKVEYFYDTNNNGTFDSSTDTNLGSATASGGKWILALSPTATSAFRTGPAVFFVRSTDQYGVTSITKFTTIVNTPPTVGSLLLTDPAFRGDKMMLTAGTVQDTAPGTIRKVAFYLDVNGNGLVDAATDKFLGYGKLVTGTANYALVASTAGFPLGTVKFIAKAIDNNGGTGTAVVTATIENSPPTVTSLSAGKAPLTQPGGTLTLAAAVKDIDGTISKVDFYYMPAGVTAADPTTDFKIGTALVGTKTTWTLVSTNTGSFATGAVRYYAIATDNNGDTSDPLVIDSTVNVPPTVGSLLVTDPAQRGSTMSLTAVNVQDTAPGTISKVAFYLDSDGNGQVDAATDSFLGYGKLVTGTTNYALVASTAGFPLGAAQFIAQAIDNNGGKGTALATATIENSPPTVASLIRNLAAVARGSSITLTAKGVADKDVTIAKVEFWSLPGSGPFDPLTATLIGEDTSAGGGYTLLYTVAADAELGTTEFFARAIDNDGLAGSAVSVSAIVTNVVP